MSIEWNYDSFVGLSFGFFVSVITVRLAHEMGRGWEQLRRQWRRDGEGD